jgi:hypothetical protein
LGVKGATGFELEGLGLELGVLEVTVEPGYPLRECGIDVVPVDILDVTFHRYPTKDVLLLFYACVLGARCEVHHFEVADHVWVSATELRRYALPPPDEKLLAKLERGVWVR